MSGQQWIQPQAGFANAQRDSIALPLFIMRWKIKGTNGDIRCAKASSAIATPTNATADMQLNATFYDCARDRFNRNFEPLLNTYPVWMLNSQRIEAVFQPLLVIALILNLPGYHQHSGKTAITILK